MTSFSVNIHHMGSFVSDPTRRYKGGEIQTFEDIDVCKWSYTEALAAVKESVRCHGNVKLWWNSNETTCQNMLKEMVSDTHALEMANYAVLNQCVVEIYVEVVDEGSPAGSGRKQDEGGEMKDQFRDDDSGGNKPDMAAEPVSLNCAAGYAVGGGGNDPFIPELVQGGHGGEDGGISEVSEGGDSDSDPEWSKRKVERYDKQEMSEKFEFKLGMEFGSTKEFKEAILQHSVLNGREIKFVKNDAERVRVKCKHDCDFLAFASKVGKSRSYRLKTLRAEHSCRRIFNNSCAKSSWVAQVVVNKLRSNRNVKLVDIIEDMRTNYSTGITFSKAWKAKKIAREIVRGDAEATPTKLLKAKNHYTCRRCGNGGHNRRKCPLPPRLPPTEDAREPKEKENV